MTDQQKRSRSPWPDKPRILQGFQLSVCQRKAIDKLCQGYIIEMLSTRVVNSLSARGIITRGELHSGVETYWRELRGTEVCFKPELFRRIEALTHFQKACVLKHIEVGEPTFTQRTIDLARAGLLYKHEPDDPTEQAKYTLTQEALDHWNAWADGRAKMGVLQTIKRSNYCTELEVSSAFTVDDLDIVAREFYDLLQADGQRQMALNLGESAETKKAFSDAVISYARLTMRMDDVEEVAA